MRGFREVGWVAAVAGTALGCYMVSLKVASERAALDQVQDRIVLAQRDIRVLQTEIGTRGRLEQLESWNVKVLALSAPQAQQFMEGSFQLATLTAPKRTVDPSAPVVLASATTPEPRSAGSAADPSDAPEAGPSARDLMQVASLKRDIAPAPDKKAVDKADAAATKPVKAAPKPVTADKDEGKKRKTAATAATEPTKAPKPAPVTKKVTVKAPDKPSKPAAPTSKSKDTKARQ